MSFHFRPAVRENVGVLISLAGASGSGKTFSALQLASGIAGGDMSKVAFIDTEARRGLHYADMFSPSFMHGEMTAPFRPGRFVEAIQAAEAAGAEVVIIDSFSHEYDGVGGVVDWADQELRQGKKSPANWMEPKKAHRKMMDALLQMRASLIFCLRADEKIEIVREGGKTQVRPLGWMPICEKRFMYEMTVSFTLTPEQPGMPRLDLTHKLQEQHRAFFPEGKRINKQAGAALRDWASGGQAPRAEKTAPSQSAHDRAANRVKTIMEALQGADEIAIDAIVADETNKALFAWLAANDADRLESLDRAIGAARAAIPSA